MNRAELSAKLVEKIHSLADTRAARHRQWHEAYAGVAYTGDSVASIMRHADHAVWALDCEIITLQGEVEALRVQIDQLDSSQE